MKFTRNIFYTLIFALHQLFNLAVLANIDYANFRIVYGTFFLLIIPGLLSYLSLKITTKDIWESLVYIVGLGVGFLIIVGLATNTLFAQTGVDQPLSTLQLLIVFNILITPLFLIAFSHKKVNRKFKLPRFNPSYLEVIMFILAISFLPLSVMGAISLNNGVSNMFTPIMLSVMGVFLIIVFLFHKKLSRSLLICSVFFISLSLLMSTSLRGWYTTGHDNQLEYFVFQLTKEDYKWDIAEYRDPYNASLSITILPAVFESLLKINDLFIFKIIYQIIFAFVAISLFVFFHKFSNKYLAFLAVLLFISFPTFVTDLPMLNRQEIAMYFFSLSLLALFSNYYKARNYSFLFVLYGIFMVLSHYSTTYIAIAYLAFTYGANFIFRKLPINFSKTLAKFKHRQRITFGKIAAIVIFTLLWNFQLTNTTQSISRITQETYQNIGQIFSQDLKSGSALYNLFSFEGLDSKDLFADYKEASLVMAREKSGEKLFSEDITKNYPSSLVPEYRKPITDIGNFLQTELNVKPYDLNYFMRQVAAKLVQLYLIIGALIILFRRKITGRNLDTEYLLIVFASLVTIALFIGLPILSLEYGTQRLFQQALVLAALPLVLGFSVFFGTIISTIYIVVIFLSLSGLIPYITGGYSPQMHLENEGSYYDSHITHDSEYHSLSWLKENYNKNNDIYVSPAARSRVTAVTGIFTIRGLLPEIVTKEDYVYLNKVNVTKSIDYAGHRGELIVYRLPMSFYNDQKNLIFDNGETKIFK